MHFKNHPYYDQSDAIDWLSLPNDQVGSVSGVPSALLDTVRTEEQLICEMALKRIRLAAGETYLAERPYPEVNDFLFMPISDRGFRVYVEFAFFARTNENSPHTDFWWAIINCPYGVATFPTGRRDYYVIALGWVVA